MTEAILAERIAQALHRKGYTVFTEVPFWLRRIDLVACLPDSDGCLAVEAKLTDWRKAIEQASIYQLCAERVVIAMPDCYAHRPDTGKLEHEGIGLWAVGDGIVELIAPRPSYVFRTHLGEKLTAAIDRWYGHTGERHAYELDRR